ncbi:alpha/beta hydrolase [Dokdonella sp.]|uniref:alpha/beta hydrolase n=1 Tax=Dokdonella sp. TaxID=2291710 RepID=UPI002F3EF263
MVLPSFRRLLRRAAWALLFAVLAALGLLLARAFEARGKPDLMPWHRIVLAQEIHADTFDARATWANVLSREQQAFDDLHAQLAAAAVEGEFRYEKDSRLGARMGERDWNRSFESTPAEPRGGVLLLHGLTDSPYSVRTLAAIYERAGFAVIAPRLPGHGTVPAGLLDVRWQDWRAVVRIAMRELRARVGADKPLHILGYSNGGALALDYALDALDDARLPAPQRIVLVSPMVGLRPFASLSRWLPLFGGFGYFEKSRWIDILPEFNPYKYNSFPTNGALQSYLLAATVRARVAGRSASGRLARLPPVLAFQSVLDSTVSSVDVVHALFDRLPANGSELVLFDINRANLLAPMFRSAAAGEIDVLHGTAPRAYRLAIVGNLGADTLEVGEKRYEAGTDAPVERAIRLAFPADVYSLSHVALPFPCDDPLYGSAPRTDEDYGIRLGTLVLRGERGALQVSAEQLQRLTCNPFFAYLEGRVADVLP